MRTTLHWGKDSTTGDINFSGVISATDVVALKLDPAQRQQLSAPIGTAADFMTCAALIFQHLQNVQRKD